MVLLLQLNGELPEFQGHERRLYVLTCRRKTCRRKEGSVRVLRGVRITELQKKESMKEDVKLETKPVFIGETLFGATPAASYGSNPFSMTGNSNPFSTSYSKAAANPFASAGLPTTELAAKPPQSPTSDLPKTFAAALSLKDDTPKFGPPPPPEPWPQDSDQPAPYPTYYLDPDYEELDATPTVNVPTQTMDLDEGSASGGKEDKDVYESTIDKTFQKFADRIQQNPEQVLRYEFRGVPLVYSKKDVTGKLLSSGGRGVPSCGNCGAKRVFEVQLTPFAILELEREESGIDGMEWGTIIVGVCEKDCQQRGVGAGEVGYVEEWAGVQWEELSR